MTAAETPELARAYRCWIRRCWGLAGHFSASGQALAVGEYFFSRQGQSQAPHPLGSAQEALEHFQRKPSFARWHPVILQD